MKIAGVVLSAVVVLVLAGILILPASLDWNSYKPQIKAQIQKHTGYDVVLDGDLNISVFPYPKAYLQDVVVRAPKAGRFETLASLKRLDLNMDLLPLFKGQFRILSVRLVQPEIFLERYADGSGSWEAPGVAVSESGDEAAGQAGGDGGSAAQVSVEELSVQGGRFVYFDAASDSSVEVQGVDATLSAESLAGPFQGRGAFVWDQRNIEFEFRTARIEPGVQSTALNASARLFDGGMAVQYSGVAVYGETMEAQGEVSISAPDVTVLLGALGSSAPAVKPHALSIKGFLSASAERVNMDSLSMVWAGTDFTGGMGASFGDVPDIRFHLEASRPFDLGQVMDVSAARASGAGTKASKGAEPRDGFLPADMALPDLGVQGEIGLPQLVLRGERYDDVAVKVALDEGKLSFSGEAGTIPGKGSLSFSGVLDESGPVLKAALDVQSANVPYTLQSLLPDAGLSQVENYKTGSLRFKGDVFRDRIVAESLAVHMDNSGFQASGVYEAAAGKRPALQVNLVSERLNLNKLLKEQKEAPVNAAQEGAGGGADMKKAAEGYALPLDVRFDAKVGTLVYGDHVFQGVAGQGTLGENSADIRALSVQSFSGAAIQGKGAVGDVRGLKAVDATVSAQSDDIRALAKILNIDTGSLPDNLGRSEISVQAKGDYQGLDILANIAAMNGKLIAKGKVRDPLGTLAAEGLSLQVQHRDANQALNILSPAAGTYESLKGPVDIYTDLQIQDKVYSLQNIKAKIAGASVQGEGRLDMAGAKPFFKGDLNFSDLKLVSSSAGAKGASGAASSAGTGSGGDVRWSRESLDLGWMHDVNFDVALRGNSLTYENWVLASPSVQAVLQDGAFNLKKLDGGVFAGTIHMTGTMAVPRDARQPVVLQGETKIRDVSLEPLVLALSGGRILKGAGKISLDTTVNASGVSPAALVYHLSGGGVVAGQDIVLDGFDLVRFGRALSEETKVGDTVLGLWKGSIKGGQTRFDTLDGAFSIHEGVVNVTRLDLDGPGVSLKTAGNVNLPQWMIATDHTVHLKEYAEVPDFTIQIRGPLDNPGQTFGQGVLDDYLKRKVQRKLNDLVGEKLDGKLNNALGQILGGGAPQAAPAAPAAGQEKAGTDGAQEGQVQPPQAQQPSQQPQQQPQQQQITPEQAIQGVLKGLLSQ